MSLPFHTLIGTNQLPPDLTPTEPPTEPPISDCANESLDIDLQRDWSSANWSADPDTPYYTSSFRLNELPLVKRPDMFKMKVPLHDSIILATNTTVATNRMTYVLYARQGDLDTLTTNDVMFLGVGGIYNLLKTIDVGINKVYVLREEQQKIMSVSMCALYKKNRNVFHNLGRKSHLSMISVKEQDKKFAKLVSISPHFMGSTGRYPFLENDEVHVKMPLTAGPITLTNIVSFILIADNPEKGNWFPLPTVKYTGCSTHPLLAFNTVGYKYLKHLFLQFSDTYIDDGSSGTITTQESWMYPNCDANYKHRASLVVDETRITKLSPAPSQNAAPITPMIHPKAYPITNNIGAVLPFVPTVSFLFYHTYLKSSILTSVAPLSDIYGETNIKSLTNQRYSSITIMYLGDVPGVHRTFIYNGTSVARMVYHNFGVIPDVMMWRNVIFMPSLGAKPLMLTHSSAPAAAGTYISLLNEKTFNTNNSSYTNSSTGTYAMSMFKNTPGFFMSGKQLATGVPWTIDTQINDIGFLMVRSVTVAAAMYYYDFNGTEAGIAPIYRKTGVTTLMPATDITVNGSMVTFNATYLRTLNHTFMWIAFSKRGGRVVSQSVGAQMLYTGEPL